MRQVTDLPLWVAAKEEAEARPRLRLVRRTDGPTCRDAARRVTPGISPLRLAVVDAICAAGPAGLTDRELEQLPHFAQYGPSTVRKRRSEAYQLGYLVPAGTRDRLTVWIAATPCEGMP